MTVEYTIIATSWQDHKEELSAVRRQVFIEEQHVPEDMEWDEYDITSQHVLALDKNGQPVGTGRLKSDGQIGRMAVIRQWRNNGIGTAMLQKILQLAEDANIKQLYLHAQTSAIEFYHRHGFIADSEEYMEAGIPHRTMTMIVD